MWSSKHWSVVCGTAMLGLLFTAPAFGWSISGVVKASDTGTPLAGVSISSFNIPGVSSVTADDGTFSIDENTLALRGASTVKASARIADNVLYIENANASLLKVSIMNVLGKVVYQKTLQQVHGNVSLSLKDLPRSAGFLRMTTDGNNQSYQMTKQGALLKTDVLPTFVFTKAGYDQAGHQMTNENETGIVVTMNPVSSNNSSGNVTPSSSNITTTSSNSNSASSFTPPEVPTNCTGKNITKDTTFQVDGRKVIVRFPSNYKGDKPVPMLVNFHPIQGSAGTWETGSAIAKKASADGVINVFPDGTAHPGMSMMGMTMQGQAWNVGPCCTDADDTSYTRHIVEKMIQEACVDPTRVYAAGFSMGGGMSNFAGCFLADIFAAAAPSAFDLANEIVAAGKCKPARPFPILNLRGKTDDIVFFNGGESNVVNGKPITFLGAEKNFQEWAKMDQCTGNTTESQTSAGGSCHIYENCAGGAKVGLCEYNTGHAELDPDMAWSFLKQFELK